MSFRKHSNPSEHEPVKALQADAYYRSIMLTHGEHKAITQRIEELGLHLHTYDLVHGVGVFYYVCRECGDGTGQILWPEGRSAV